MLKRLRILLLLFLVVSAPGCRALAVAGAIALDEAFDDDTTFQPGVHDHRRHRHHHRRRCSTD